MITEEQKYKAYTYNIAGFALMTPLGKIVLDYAALFKQMDLYVFVFNSFLALLLFCCGLTSIEVGRRILDTRRRY